MKKRLLILLIAIIPATAFTVHTVKVSSEKEAVEDLIMKSYVHGAFNELNPEAMLSGFHPDFAIFSANGETLARYEIKVWADGVRKRKSDPKFDAAKNVWEHNFASVDVTGNVAAVKIELSKEGKHIYTDYLSLIKFDSGWKIVAKVYNKHE